MTTLIYSNKKLFFILFQNIVGLILLVNDMFFAI
jgi:hypothetical protein